MSKSEEMKPPLQPYYLIVTRLSGDERWTILAGGRDYAICWRRLRGVAAVLPDADYDVWSADDVDWTKLK